MKDCLPNNRKAASLPYHSFSRRFALKNSFLITGFLLLAAASSACCPADGGGRDSSASGPGNCGTLNGPDVLIVDSRCLKRLRFNGDLAQVYKEKKIFYVNRAGKTRRTHYFDNGADPFTEGLARARLGGKYGFMNRKLELVIKPAFDFAFPFQRGFALVCNGCKPEPMGEHQAIRGGKWGVLDKTGEIRVPIRFSRSALLKRPEYKKLKREP